MIFCSQCGKQLNDGTTFCSQCGTPVSSTNQTQTNNPPPAGAYSQSNAFTSNIGKTPVKTDYSIGLFILLSILTCGIYGYYIVYKLASDVNQICAEDGEKVGGLAAYILLSFLTCGIYNIYWLYKIQNRMHAIAPRYGVVVGEDGGTVLLWIIVGMLLCVICQYVAYNIVFKTANKLGMAYNAKYFYNI